MKVNSKRIRVLMAEMRIGTYELAEMAGVTPATICRVLRVGSCTGKTVGKIATALEVPVADIVED